MYYNLIRVIVMKGCEITNVFYYFHPRCRMSGGTQWRSWMRHYATSRKVAGSIPDGVIGIFH